VTSTSQYAGRSTRRYKRLRIEFRARCELDRLPCWLCGRTINYALPVGHPDSFNLDHAVPVAKRRDLAEDPANFRPSHSDCNLRRGDDGHSNQNRNKNRKITVGITSERW
jgi:hypothetical protein